MSRRYEERDSRQGGAGLSLGRQLTVRWPHVQNHESSESRASREFRYQRWLTDAAKCSRQSEARSW